jgi:hypothetical protein
MLAITALAFFFIPDLSYELHRPHLWTCSNAWDAASLILLQEMPKDGVEGTQGILSSHRISVCRQKA